MAKQKIPEKYLVERGLIDDSASFYEKWLLKDGTRVAIFHYEVTRVVSSLTSQNSLYVATFDDTLAVPQGCTLGNLISSAVSVEADTGTYPEGIASARADMPNNLHTVYAAFQPWVSNFSITTVAEFGGTWTWLDQLIGFEIELPDGDIDTLTEGYEGSPEVDVPIEANDGTQVIGMTVQGDAFEVEYPTNVEARQATASMTQEDIDKVNSVFEKLFGKTTKTTAKKAAKSKSK